jgi:hypothetical protein
VDQKITLNKDIFLRQFLLPVSKLTDNASFCIETNKIYTTCNSNDGSVVLYAEFKTETSALNLPKINIPDIKKFIRLLECIDQPEVTLTVTNNALKYDTAGLKFNYFLIDDSYIQKSPVNPQKIQQLEFDTLFELTNTKFNEILKGSSIATDTDKLYFFTRDDKVYAELNDHQRQNVNNITYLITNEYNGKEITDNIPLNLENFRVLSGLGQQQFSVKINNNLKIVLFENYTNLINTKFIISALVK